MLVRLAVWYLRKRKRSVLINFKIRNAEINQIQDNSFIHNCAFENYTYYFPDGTTFEIPDGRYSIKKKAIK